jgi:hypothetical protein
MGVESLLLKYREVNVSKKRGIVYKFVYSPFLSRYNTP